MSNHHVSRRTFLQSTVGTGVVAALAAGRTRASAPTAGEDWRVLPEDPYITVAHGAPYFRPDGTHGWDAADPSDQTATIRGLHADFLDFRRLVWADGNAVDFPPGVAEQLEFSNREHLPATSAQTIYLLTNGDELDRISWLRSDREWTLPDGSRVDSSVELLGRDFDGEAHGLPVMGGYRGVPSVFAPAILDILTLEAEQSLSAGFVSMFLDSVTTPRLRGLDFSPWAQAAFREHLASLPAERLDELGVDDPESLDVRAAFRDRGVAPFETDDPATDPLFREYNLHHHRGLKALTRAYRERLNDLFPERGPAGSATLNGNHYLGDAFQGQPAPAVYTTDAMDYVTIEDNRTKPPEHVREPLYKLARAMTREEKPALVEGQMHTVNGVGRGLDLDRQYLTLRRLQFAEAYASGVPRKIPLTSWGNVPIDETITHWLAADGSVPPELQSLVDFLWTNQRFLRGATPDNDVAVVYSLPTLLWHRTPQWGQNANRQRAAFRGVTTALREAQIPYDVTVFGHPELWNDDWHLDRLADYDAVVLPDVDCVTDAQVDALAGVLDDDGTVVAAGRQPARTANYEQRSTDWLDHDGVVSLAESPLLHRIDDDDGDDDDDDDDDGDSRRGRRENFTGALPDALSDTASVAVDEPHPLAVNCLQNDGVRQIHLLNYDYDESTDEVAAKTDVTVTVENESATVARWVSPTETTNLDLESVEDGVRVTVPAVEEWGFVALADSPAALRSDASRETAERAVEEQQTLAAEHEPIRATTSASVDTMLTEAELALDAAAYDLAVERAERVHEELQRFDLLPTTTTTTTTSSTTETTTTDQSTSRRTDDQTDGSVPGFGPGVGLTALGAGALWRYLRSDEDDQT